MLTNSSTGLSGRSCLGLARRCRPPADDGAELHSITVLLGHRETIFLTLLLRRDGVMRAETEGREHA